jgi:hypothetical protein
LPLVLRLIRTHDYVINCSGDPVTSALLSCLCGTEEKTVVHAGVFSQGVGGFVLRQEPGGPCYSCLYPVTRKTQGDTNATLNDFEDHYGFSPSELDAQVGLWPDVNIVSAVQVRVVADRLKHDPSPADPNLFLIDNRNLAITKVRLRKNPRCHCNSLALGREWFAAPRPKEES